jgi:hypothetical protein
MGAFFFGFSATIASVVISSPAIEAASCRAVRTTLVGSMIPFETKSPYSPSCALAVRTPFVSHYNQIKWRRVSVHWFAGVLQSLCSPS